MLSIFFGLSAALGWGAGDFAGGLASRKTGAYRAVFYSEIFGVLLLFIMLGIFREPFPDLRAWSLSMLAGAIGTLGLILLYQAMTQGLMSISAPVSALLAALIPVLAGLFKEGLPNMQTFTGFGFALAAVWLVSQSEGGLKNILTHLADLKMPLLAGIGFGLYFILMHEATSTGATVWPMLGSRTGGTLLIAAYMLISRTPWKVEDKSAWKFLILNGVFDIAGNVFFILAGQMGRLDVASVLSSLFSGVTVILAWIFLKERLTRGQWIGVSSALVAIVLMTV
jgi:drug/metabolite transporter (DMT)-like permease